MASRSIWHDFHGAHIKGILHTLSGRNWTSESPKNCSVSAKCWWNPRPFLQHFHTYFSQSFPWIITHNSNSLAKNLWLPCGILIPKLTSTDRHTENQRLWPISVMKTKIVVLKLQVLHFSLLSFDYFRISSPFWLRHRECQFFTCLICQVLNKSMHWCCQVLTNLDRNSDCFLKPQPHLIPHVFRLFDTVLQHLQQCICQLVDHSHLTGSATTDILSTNQALHYK